MSPHRFTALFLITLAGIAQAQPADGLPLPDPAHRLRVDGEAGQPGVVVVAIDRKTLAALGPFGGAYRARHASLIEALDRAGARGIALDICFPESPAFTAGTAAIARAAGASRAPVVVGVYSELDDQGREVVEPNAAVLRAERRVIEGAVLARDELHLELADGPGGVETRAGERLIMARAAGKDALVIALAGATGVMNPSDFPLVGLVEPALTGVTFGPGQDMPIAEERTPALRPQVGDPSTIKTVSYVDVLRGRVAPGTFRGALVLVGMHDGRSDVVAHPDPARPELSNLSGVYLHAFALRRALEVSARITTHSDLEPLEAESPATAGTPGANETPGIIGGLRGR